MSAGRAVATQDDQVSFRVLGPLTVTSGSDDVVLQPSKPASLLAALLLHPNETVSTQALQRAVWGEERLLTKAALQTCALRLRQLFLRHGIAQTAIETVPGGYRIVATAESLDLVRFRTLVREAAAAGDRETELSILEEALALWHGPVLANVPSELLQRDLVPRITEERLRVVERVSDLKLSLGRSRSALVGLWEAARTYPHHERFAEQLAEALYRTGRQADALAELRRVRTYLNDELGVDPGPGLQQLERAILRGEQLGGDEAAASAAPARRLVTQPGLVGREGVARVVADRLGNDGALVVLTGPPGVGKTALAHHVTTLVGSLWRGDPWWVPMSTPAGPAPDGEVESQLREVTATGAGEGAGGLVVLDGVASVEAAVRAIGHAGGHARFLLTSRHSLSGLVARYGGWLHRLDALAPADAVELLAGMLGPDRVEPEREALRELAELCGHLPLALRILGARLQSRPQMALADAVGWLREERLARLALPGDPDMSLTGRLDGAFRQLDQTLRAAVLRLGAARSPRLTVDTCTDLFALAPEPTEHLLEQLVDTSWVEGGPRHYWMHDLLYLYAGAARDRWRGPATALDAKGSST